MHLTVPLQYRFVSAPSPQKPAPLLVVLHGRGDSPEGFSWLPQALGFSNLAYLFLQAPDPYYTGYSWYDHPPNQGPGISRSQELLTQVFDQLWSAGFAPSSTALFGFSQGCLMTLEFGARYHLPLAAYIGISGYCFDENRLTHETSDSHKQAPWLVTHGTQDEVLPVSRTREQMNRLIQSGFQIDYREFDKSHTIDENEEFPLIRSFIAQHLGGI